MKGIFKKYMIKDRLKFILPSALGILLFMFPMNLDGNWTILIKYIADHVYVAVEHILPMLCLLIMTASAVLSLLGYFRPSILEHHEILKEGLHITPAKVISRIFAVFVILITYLEYDNGIFSYISDHNTGGFVLHHMLPLLVVVDTIASFLLPLLLDFGLLEYIGAKLMKVMRPLFRLPGRAAIDCITSWVGDGTLGVILTHHQYEDGHYSEREAAVIATTFSAVSITLSLVILSEVNLMEYFGLYYLCICGVGFVCAIILPRIPPLSLKKDVYLTDEHRVSEETPDEHENSHSYGLELAVKRASKHKSIRPFFHHGVSNTLTMWLNVLPTIVTIGSLSLIVAMNTDIFTIMGKPFIPLLDFFRIPEAAEASQTLVVGFISIFTPAMLAEELIVTEMTKFIIAVVSVTQLIYLSEIGSLVIGLKLPVKLYELFIIFIERTIISLLIICPVAQIIFS